MSGSSTRGGGSDSVFDVLVAGTADNNAEISIGPLIGRGCVDSSGDTANNTDLVLVVVNVDCVAGGTEGLFFLRRRLDFVGISGCCVVAVVTSMASGDRIGESTFGKGASSLIRIDDVVLSLMGTLFFSCNIPPT